MIHPFILLCLVVVVATVVPTTAAFNPSVGIHTVRLPPNACAPTCMVSLSSHDAESTSDTDDSLPLNRLSSNNNDKERNTDSFSRPSLGLLTFDLDDTLFPVAQVVQDANTAMIDAMHKFGYTSATNDRIIQHTKALRNKKRKRMTYTELRKKAIAMEMEYHHQQNLCTTSTAITTHTPPVLDDDLVHAVFDAWIGARHESANKHLFDGCIEMLNAIQEEYDVCIGAITNGRGNPLEMKSLQSVFDFCVSGEDDHVFPFRKPHATIFKASLSEYHKRRPTKLDAYNSIWIHVGDCLANDVGGSSKLGAYPIWCELDELRQDSDDDDQQQPWWSTAPAQVTKSRKKLADKARGSVQVRITSLHQLPTAIDAIIESTWKKKNSMKVQNQFKQQEQQL